MGKSKKLSTLNSSNRCIASSNRCLTSSNKKLVVLKIPWKAVRLRLFKGSILAGIRWGHEAMGVAPQTRARYRAAMARHLGMQKTGNIDLVIDLQPNLQKSWQVHTQLLDSVKHPWQHAKGPIAALQCYLREHGWTHESFDQWSKPGHNGLPTWEINITDLWNSIHTQLKETEKWERVHRVNKHAMPEEVQFPLDWVAWKRLNRQLNQRDATALLTWHQGALFLKLSDSKPHGYLTCPHCHAPATAVHVLWLCEAMKKHFKPLPEEWVMELTHG